MNAHVRAHRPIGGSSAGLAILGHYSYISLDRGSMESSIALSNSYDAGVTLENNFLHFRWLENVMTDTHFSARCRPGRLITFLARINQDQQGAGQSAARQPGAIWPGTIPYGTTVFGIGMDEKTALLIGPDGVGRLAPGSAGSAWVVMLQHQATILAQGQPLSLQGIRIIRLEQNSDIDLTSRHVSHAAAETIDSIQRGAPTQNSIASPIMMRTVVPPDES